jgi:hypothetical protein
VASVVSERMIKAKRMILCSSELRTDPSQHESSLLIAWIDDISNVETDTNPVDTGFLDTLRLTIHDYALLYFQLTARL